MGFNGSGQRLDSTRSCALQQTHNLFGDDPVRSRLQISKESVSQYSNPTSGLEALRQPGDESFISDDTGFKVPKSIIKDGKHPKEAATGGLSTKYLGLIIKKKQQQMSVLQTPQFGSMNESDSQSSSMRYPSKHRMYVRGPYKTKRNSKLDSKRLDYELSQNSNECNKSSKTLVNQVRTDLANKILEQIESSKDSQSAVDDGPKSCNCSNTGCLKLYCECFKNNRHCNGHCRCMGCSNCPKHEARRLEAMQAILIRNPLAFRKKVVEQNQTRQINEIESITAGGKTTSN